MGIDMLPVLHFQGDSILSQSQDKLHLRLHASFGEVSYVQVRYPSQEISGCALSNMPGKIAQVRGLGQPIQVGGDDLPSFGLLDSAQRLSPGPIWGMRS